MNGLERARTAFAHREADRVPVYELTIDNPTAAQVLGRDTLCGFGGRVRGLLQNRALLDGSIADFHRRRLDDDIALYRALEMDMFPHVAPLPRAFEAPEPVGEHTWRFSAPGGGWSISQYIEDSDTYDQVDSSLRRNGLAELERVTADLEAHPPALEDWNFEPVDHVLRELGGEMMLLGHADVEIGSTWDWAETFLIGLVEAPSLIERYLDARLNTALMLGEAMLQRGVHGLEGGWDWASAKGPLFSPRHFRKFVFPRLKRIVDLCHRYGAVYVKHTDGNINSLMDDLVACGVDGFEAIEPRAGMDLARLKREYGDRLTLIGNVDCSTVLVDGPVEAVEAQTEWVIRTGAPGGGFFLATSNSVHPGVKPEYYRAMLATARRMGAYPIQEAA